MDHLAIMNPAWGLTTKILNGQKTIESRWYRSRRAPWNHITTGDVVYFKDSGQPVTVKARVKAVRQFSDLQPSTVRRLLAQYGAQDGITSTQRPFYYRIFKNKRYCILVFLADVRPTKPFRITKRGYGLQTAWITVPHISTLHVK